jgi:hypothetical protein
MTGIGNLVQAFMGGDKYEMEAFNRQMNQMVAAGTREAALAEKLAQAEIVKDQLAARQGLRQSFKGTPAELNAILASLTGEMRDTVQTRGYQRAHDIAGMLPTGTPAEQFDALNAFLGVGSGKPLSPENVAILGQGQAKEAEIRATAALRDAQAAEASAGASYKTAQAGEANKRTELMTGVPGSNFTLTRDQSSLLSEWTTIDEEGNEVTRNLEPYFYSFMLSPEGVALVQQGGPQAAFAYFVSEAVNGVIPGQRQAAAGGGGGEVLVWDPNTGEFHKQGGTPSVIPVSP